MLYLVKHSKVRALRVEDQEGGEMGLRFLLQTSSKYFEVNPIANGGVAIIAQVSKTCKMCHII